MTDDLLDRLLSFVESTVSRICHDISDPIVAMSSVTEFLNSDKSDMRSRAAELINASSHQAVVKLRLLRYCYGSNIAFSDVSIDSIKSMCDDYFEFATVSVNWDPKYYIIDPYMDNRIGKIVVNIILSVSQCLIYGGVIDISFSTSDHALVILLKASGRQIRMDDDIKNILSGNDEKVKVTSHNIQPAYCRKLLDLIGSKLDLISNEKELTISITISV